MSFFKGKPEKNDLIHKGFELGLLLKGIDSTLELIGGVMLLFLTPGRLNRLARLLTRHELSEDPTDMIAGAILNLSSKFTVSSQSFAAFYLISHGIIRIILVILLMKRKIWAYPVTMVSLVLFIIYEIHRFILHHSIWMIVLIVFDSAMIFLTYKEYVNIRDRI